MMHISGRAKLPVGFKRPDGLEYTHYRYDAGFEVTTHSHDDAYEIYFFLDGAVDYIVESKRYTLAPGDILLISNRVLHRPYPDVDRPYERIVISLGLEFLRNHYLRGEEAGRCFVQAAACRHYAIQLGAGERATAVYQCLARLEDEVGEQQVLGEQMVDAILLQLLVTLNRCYEQSVSETDGIVVASNKMTDSIVRYINENLEEDLSLERLSEKFFVSKYHLAREFKKYTGYTVHSFILKKRLLTARVLLREQNSILDVSLQCGFRDYSTFVRAFKAEFGLTPYQYMHPFGAGT